MLGGITLRFTKYLGGSWGSCWFGGLEHLGHLGFCYIIYADYPWESYGTPIQSYGVKNRSLPTKIPKKHLIQALLLVVGVAIGFQ